MGWLLKTYEEIKENKPKESFFAWWWHNIGSGIVPNDGEDLEEHTHRVCKAFADEISKRSESNEFRDKIKKAIEAAEEWDHWLHQEVINQDEATIKVITTIKDNLL